MKSADDNRKHALSENLKRFRRAKNWNQNQLAEAADLSLGAIKQIETGKRWPKSSTLELLASALDVSSSELLGARPEASPTVSSLLLALEHLEKENKHLKDLIGPLPDSWLKRLNNPKDPFGIVARAWIVGNLREIEAAERHIRSTDIFRAKAKSEQEDPSSSEIA